MRTIRHGLFEWDEDKADRNANKHGVTFEDAAAFLSHTPLERHLIEYDDAHSHGEDRYDTLVPHPDDPEVLLWVCSTDRDDEEGATTRIISARLATPGEEKRYARWLAGKEGRA